MGKKKKNVDLSCLSNTPEKVKEMLKLGVPPGMFMTTMDEDFPKLEKGACEVVYSGYNNSEIVLGRDRNASLASGKGGMGGTGAGCIDLVAGRLSAVTGHCQKLTGPNWAADAARVYISQRAHVDKYLGLPKCTTVPNTNNASAVVMKADHARIVGRESVRIYAGVGEFAGTGWKGELNSRGGQIELPGSVIELIGGGQYDSIQPAALGTNTKFAIKTLYEYVRQNQASIYALHTILEKVYIMLMSHVHPHWSGPTFPSPSGLVIGFESFAKGLLGKFDQVLKQLDAIINEIGHTGIGPENFNIPGWLDIESTNVFLT